MVPKLKPLLASGAAFGVFLGDELLWDCVPYADLVTAANLVRADLDREKEGSIKLTGATDVHLMKKCVEHPSGSLMALEGS